MIVLRFVRSRLVLRSLAGPDEVRARVTASCSISLRLSTSRPSPERGFRPALIAAASMLAASFLRHDLGWASAGHHCACTVPVRCGLPGCRLARSMNLVEPVVLVRDSLAGKGNTR